MIHVECLGWGKDEISIVNPITATTYTSNPMDNSATISPHK